MSAWPARERGRGALTYELGEDGVHGIRDVHPVAAVRMVKVPLDAPAKEPGAGQHQAAGAGLGEGGGGTHPARPSQRNEEIKITHCVAQTSSSSCTSCRARRGCAPSEFPHRYVHGASAVRRHGEG